MKLWTRPLLYGAASAAGLIAALLGDGWLDAVSWLALGAPVIPIVQGLRAVCVPRRETPTSRGGLRGRTADGR